MKHQEALDHTPLTFGKYRGKTPDQVAEVDPGYVVWMYNNIDRPVCSKLLAEACRSPLGGDTEDDSGVPDTYEQFKAENE